MEDDSHEHKHKHEHDHGKEEETSKLNPNLPSGLKEALKRSFVFPPFQGLGVFPLEAVMNVRNILKVINILAFLRS
jgi:hypothetical protein